VRTQRYGLQTALLPQMYNCPPVLAEKLPKTTKCFGKFQDTFSQNPLHESQWLSEISHKKWCRENLGVSTVKIRRDYRWTKVKILYLLGGTRDDCTSRPD
jgi:hypothetical protein